MEVKIDHEWSTFLKIFEKFFLHRPSGVLELRQRVRPDGAAPLLHRLSGALELRERVRPDRAAPFLHRLTGALELRKRVRPDGAAPFLHRLSGVLELPLAGSPLTGGEFFAEIQRGDSPSADGGDVAAPAAGAKRKGHLRFPFLFELLPFPCFLIRRRFPICDRCETGERQRIFSSVSFATCSQCQISYCYTCD